jgi:hypothetical protein
MLAFSPQRSAHGLGAAIVQAGVPRRFIAASTDTRSLAKGSLFVAVQGQVAGERYFAEQLLDFDLAANNGGWQWAASTGCDAQPYFRIFNPVTQSEKFDAEGKFIRRYVPELASVPNKKIHAPWQMGRIEQETLGVVIGRDYPAPIVDPFAILTGAINCVSDPINTSSSMMVRYLLAPS